MKNRIASCSALLYLLAVGSTASAVSLTVVPSSAPNFFGSPSWAAYQSNALNSLENGLGNIGDRDTDPTAYEITGAKILHGDIIVTNFNSWRGEIGPSSPFDNEHGNRLHFGLHVLGEGTQFRLEDLSYDITSSDGNFLAFAGSFAGLSYSSSRIGIDYVDGIKGNGNDVIINSGLATQLVDELMYVGVGNAYDASTGIGYPLPDTPQSNMAALGDYLRSQAPITVTGSYSLAVNSTTFTSSASVDVVCVPEPLTASLGLLSMGVLAIATRRRVV